MSKYGKCGGFLLCSRCKIGHDKDSFQRDCVGGPLERERDALRAENANMRDVVVIAIEVLETLFEDATKKGLDKTADLWRQHINDARAALAKETP